MIEEMNKVKALFPDNVEKIIISKDDYDRLTGDLTLESIELKQEIERLNNIIKEAIEHLSIKQIRFINEKDYVLNDEDLDEIMKILEGTDKE